MLARLFGLVVAGIAFSLGYYENSGEFMRMVAEWQWWLLLWVITPIFTIILLGMQVVFWFIGKDVGGKMGAIGGSLAGAFLSLWFILGLGLSFLEAQFLWKAYETSTNLTEFNAEYLYLWLGVIILNIIAGWIRGSSSSNTSKE